MQPPITALNNAGIDREQAFRSFQKLKSREVALAEKRQDGTKLLFLLRRNIEIGLHGARRLIDNDFGTIILGN